MNNNFFKYAIVFICAVIVAWAVQDHLITKCFAWLMDLIFDSFSLKTSSIIADIIILIIFSIFLFGLIKMFFITEGLIIIAIIAVCSIGYYFYHHDEIKYTEITWREK